MPEWFENWISSNPDVKNSAVFRAFLVVDEENLKAIHLYTNIGFLPSDSSGQIDMINDKV